VDLKIATVLTATVTPPVGFVFVVRDTLETNARHQFVPTSVLATAPATLTALAAVMRAGLGLLVATNT
jgi:hypothetical protein